MTDCITPRAWIPDAAVAIRRGIFGDTGAGKFVRPSRYPAQRAGEMAQRRRNGRMHAVRLDFRSFARGVRSGAARRAPETSR